MSKAIERLEDLKPDPRNANKGTARGQSLIETSVRQRGAGRSGLAAADGTMIAGSQTLQKMAELGIPVRTVHTQGDEWVVVVRDDIAPGSEAATLLALEDNRANEVGLEWDAGLLATLAADTPDLLAGLWRDDELAALLAGIEPEIVPGGGGDEFDTTPAAAEATRVQPGDVWQVGDHLVACLDSTDPAAVAQAVGTVVPTFIWADPPYGIAIVDVGTASVGGGAVYNIPFGGVKNRKAGLGSANGAKPFGSDHPVRGSDGASNRIKVGSYAPVIGDDSTRTAIDAFTLHHSLYPTALHIWWGGNYYAEAMPPSSCWLVWDKENTGNFADAELAWCSSKTAVRIFRHMWNGLMKASERGEKRVHPTQKPIALAQWAFEKYGAAGDVIVDPFLGSGMSLIAAHRLGQGRRVVGFELSPAYCDVILRRAAAEGIGPIVRVPNA